MVFTVGFAITSPPMASTTTRRPDLDADGLGKGGGRDLTVDTVRGLAIAAMVWGHLGIAIYHPVGHGRPSPTLTATPPLWTEVFGGIAPVLFVVVAGMMVAHVYRRHSAGLRRQAKRMVILLCIGAAIDVLFWRIRPFTTVDILYCLALALPLSHLFAAHAPPWTRWPLVVGVFALTPLLQRGLGYADYPTEYTLSGHLVMAVDNQTSVLNHWLVDGWFPLFPWVGFAFLGVLLAERRRAKPRRGMGLDLPMVAAGLLLLLASLVLGWPDAGARSVARLNAGGAFMPPDVGYVLASVAVVLLLISICDRLPLTRLSQPLRLLGRVPLFLYVVHFPVVHLATRLLPSRLRFELATLAILATLAGLAVMAWLWLQLRLRLGAAR